MGAGGGGVILCYSEAPALRAEQELAPEYGTNAAKHNTHKQPSEVGSLDFGKHPCLQQQQQPKKKGLWGGFLAFLWEIKKRGNSNYNLDIMTPQTGAVLEPLQKPCKTFKAPCRSNQSPFRRATAALAQAAVD